MPNIFDTDYKVKVENDMPPDKRVTKDGITRNKMVNWLWSIISSPMQWIHDLIFVSYKTGALAALWNAGITYSFGERAVVKNQLWQSIQDDNINNAPVLNSAWWILVQDSIFGSDARLNDGPQIITLTNALNREFNKEYGTVFRQPPLISDIYIESAQPIFTSFTVADTEPLCGDINDDGSTMYVFDEEVYTGEPVYSFKIKVPAAVYAALGITAEQIIRQVADLYVISGVGYIIETY